MKTISAAVSVGAAAWCSLGTLGLIGSDSAVARIGLLPPWWLLAVFIGAAFAVLRLLRLSRSQIAPLFGATVALLPWLPVPLPAAALLWTGPLVIAIWIAVIVGVIAARERPVRHQWLTDPRRAPTVAGAVALVLYGASAWWLSPILPDGDAPHYLIITQSLIKDGDLRIENNHRQGDHLEYAPQAAEPHYQVRGVDGAIYSIHAPGLSILVAPAFLLFGYPGVIAFLGLVAALGTALVWHLGHRITGSAGAAWFGWACCALTTPFFFQATQVFPDGLAALCVLLGMFPVLSSQFSVRAAGFSGLPKADPTDDSGWVWLLSGVSLAILPWLQTRLTIIAVTAALLVILRLRSVRHFVLFAAAPIVSAVAWFTYFYVIYGTPNPTAPYGDNTQTTIGNLARGFPGLMFDQQFGLIPNAPVYAFILAGAIVAAIRRQRWSWELLLVMAPYIIGVGMFQLWWGGASAPVRLLAPLAMLLGVAAARIWRTQRNTAQAVGLAALIASALVTAALLVPGRGRLLFNDRDGVALWLDWASDLLDLPNALPSVFRDTPGQVWLKTAIWCVGFAAAWLVLKAVGQRRGHQRGVERSAFLAFLSLPAIWCLSAALMIALSLGWRVDGAEPLTPATSELQLLRHASRFHPVAYNYREGRFERSPAALSRVRIRRDRQRRPASAESLLVVSDVPAGVYQVHVKSPGPAEGHLVLRVGDTPVPLWTASLSGTQADSVGGLIQLPVVVASLMVEGDEAARRTIGAVELGPLGPEHFFDRATAATGGRAYRAARYGSAQVYFMDPQPYPEASGFWVEGGHTARIVVANDGGRRSLFLRNAPIDNTVMVDVDGQRQDIRLRPREEWMVDLRPNSASGTVLRIRPQNGIRPSQFDPGNADTRYLGCWVEIR